MDIARPALLWTYLLDLYVQCGGFLFGAGFELALWLAESIQ